MFKKVNQDSLVDIGGRTWNEVANRLNEIEFLLKEVRKLRPEDRTAVRVKNEKGSDIAPFEIVAIGDPATLPSVSTPAFEYQHVFEGDSTDANTVNFGIALEGIPHDIGNGHKGVGRVVVSGIATAKVDVTDAGHKYAKPSATDGQLESSATGPLKILYSDSTGVQVCKVIFEPASQSSGSSTECVPGISKNSMHMHTLTADWDSNTTQDVDINGVTKTVLNTTSQDFTQPGRVMIVVTDSCEFIPLCCDFAIPPPPPSNECSSTLQGSFDAASSSSSDWVVTHDLNGEVAIGGDWSLVSPTLTYSDQGSNVERTVHQAFKWESLDFQTLTLTCNLTMNHGNSNTFWNGIFIDQYSLQGLRNIFGQFNWISNPGFPGAVSRPWIEGQELKIVIQLDNPVSVTGSRIGTITTFIAGTQFTQNTGVDFSALDFCNLKAGVYVTDLSGGGTLDPSTADPDFSNFQLVLS